MPQAHKNEADQPKPPAQSDAKTPAPAKTVSRKIFSDFASI